MHPILAVTLGGLALAGAQTGQLGDAKVVSGNPAGVRYQATLPDKQTTGVRGSISASAGPDGTGVAFEVSFYGFPPPSELGPFIYHIHDQPVPADGNCTKTLAHQDPYIRGEKPPCNPAAPQTCQTGDLSGKHGNITGTSFKASYVDSYLSIQKSLEGGAFLGNRSIVVHSSNTTRLNCANFVLVSSGTSSNSTNTTGGAGGSGGSNGGSPPTPTGITPFEGSAAANFAGVSALVGLAVAGVAFLL